MNENKDIIVAMTGTVTIATEEYAALLRRGALLDVIIAHQKRAPYDADVSRLVEIVGGMVLPVITSEGAGNA